MSAIPKTKIITMISEKALDGLKRNIREREERFPFPMNSKPAIPVRHLALTDSAPDLKEAPQQHNPSSGGFFSYISNKFYELFTCSCGVPTEDLETKEEILESLGIKVEDDTKKPTLTIINTTDFIASFEPAQPSDHYDYSDDSEIYNSQDCTEEDSDLRLEKIRREMEELLLTSIEDSNDNVNKSYSPDELVYRPVSSKIHSLIKRLYDEDAPEEDAGRTPQEELTSVDNQMINSTITATLYDIPPLDQTSENYIDTPEQSPEILDAPPPRMFSFRESLQYFNDMK